MSLILKIEIDRKSGWLKGCLTGWSESVAIRGVYSSKCFVQMGLFASWFIGWLSQGGFQAVVRRLVIWPKKGVGWLVLWLVDPKVVLKWSLVKYVLPQAPLMYWHDIPRKNNLLCKLHNALSEFLTLHFMIHNLSQVKIVISRNGKITQLSCWSHFFNSLFFFFSKYSLQRIHTRKLWVSLIIILMEP